MRVWARPRAESRVRRMRAHSAYSSRRLAPTDDHRVASLHRDQQGASSLRSTSASSRVTLSRSVHVFVAPPAAFVILFTTTFFSLERSEHPAVSLSLAFARALYSPAPSLSSQPRASRYRSSLHRITGRSLCPAKLVTCSALALARPRLPRVVAPPLGRYVPLARPPRRRISLSRAGALSLSRARSGGGRPESRKKSRAARGGGSRADSRVGASTAEGM